MDDEVMEELARKGIRTLDELNEALKRVTVDIRLMGRRTADDDIRDRRSTSVPD